MDLIKSVPRTKISIPPTTPWIMTRNRLTRRFQEALHHKLCLVVAPAGYGKTTFIIDALSRISCKVAWVSLDKFDNNICFWNNLVSALKKESLLSDINFRVGFKTGEPSSNHLTEIPIQLANALEEYSSECMIVLDDYNNITDVEVHESINNLIKYLPSQVHLVISSRVVPPFALSQLRGHGQLMEIGMADLRFSLIESRTFLNEVMKLGLSREEVVLLTLHTEGWISGLQMATILMRGGDNNATFIANLKGTNKDIAAYFFDEVLAKQESHIITFLLKTSILDDLRAPLCNAITDREDSQEILEQLVANNIFLLPLDDEEKLFRFHNLFGELLYNELKKRQPELEPTLHLKASKWYENNGLYKEAIDHAIAANELKQATDLIHHIALDVLTRDDIIPIRTWVGKLPDQLVSEDLQICSAAVISAEIDGQLDKQKNYWQYVNTQFISNAGKVKLNDDSDARIRDLTATTRALSLYLNGDIDEAILLARDALLNLPLSNGSIGWLLYCMLGTAYWAKGELESSYHCFKESVARLVKSGGQSYFAKRIIAAMAHTQFARGYLQSAEDICNEAIQFPGAGDELESPGASHVCLLLGEILYQKNEINSAEMYIHRAIDLSIRCEDWLTCLIGYFALARIRLARGELKEAREEIVQAKKYALKSDSRGRFQADVFLTYFALRQGNIREATDIAYEWRIPHDQDDAGSSSIIMKFPFRYDVRDIWCENPYITLLRLYLAQNKTGEMEAVLQDIKQQLLQRHSEFHLIECLILEALMYQAQGKVRQAVETLTEVFIMTEPEGYVRVFIDEGNSMGALLREAKKMGIKPDYISKPVQQILHSGLSQRNFGNATCG